MQLPSRLQTGAMPDDVYPLPKPSTVKELYGSAFRCAHPDCSRPLYRTSDDTGDRILNSRVAHIHARRRNGPRWKEMSAEENRSFDNLLLLCIDHSYEIDEAPESFEPHTLRDWKAAQIAEYDRLQRNWPISEDEATEVLIASEAFDALHAPSTLELVRRVEAFRLAALRKREVVRGWARAWQLIWEQSRLRSRGMWDLEGNDVYIEPSESEVRPMKDGIRSEISAALADVVPAADAARVELAAVRATRRDIAPWCDDLERRIAELITEFSAWRGGPNPNADAGFDEAVDRLERSISDLVSTSRGEPVDPPEPPP